jgi:hypothetical protein
MTASPATPVVPVPDVAGVSLAAPRLHYEVLDRPWGSATLARPHAARALEGAVLKVRLVEGDEVVTFEMKSFIHTPVQPYIQSPAAAWRGLLVDHGLLARPELVWSGKLPAGWDAGLPAPWATSLRDALAELHRRWTSHVHPPSMDYMLRMVECAGCRAAREAATPGRLLPGQRFVYVAPPPRCAHGPHAMRALGELCALHPELTFEMLGWIEPAGARLPAEGPTPARFVLTGPVVEALLGPWLVGDELLAQQRAQYRGYDFTRRTYQPAWTPDARRPTLPRWEHAAVALCASAWGYAAQPDALVAGSAGSEAGAAAPALDPAPPLEVPPALPGVTVPSKAARARARTKA